MLNSTAYFARFQTARGGFGSLPPFARSMVTLFALPGIVLLLLSILLGIVSIFVLLLLTVPVYRVLQAVFGSRQPISAAQVQENPFASLFGQMSATGGESVNSPGRKQVDSRIIDSGVVDSDRLTD